MPKQDFGVAACCLFWASRTDNQKLRQELVILPFGRRMSDVSSWGQFQQYCLQYYKLHKMRRFESMLPTLCVSGKRWTRACIWGVSVMGAAQGQVIQLSRWLLPALLSGEVCWSPREGCSRISVQSASGLGFTLKNMDFTSHTANAE